MSVRDPRYFSWGLVKKERSVVYGFFVSTRVKLFTSVFLAQQGFQPRRLSN
jgi:hypothetical protein